MYRKCSGFPLIGLIYRLKILDLGFQSNYYEIFALYLLSLPGSYSLPIISIPSF